MASSAQTILINSVQSVYSALDSGKTPHPDNQTHGRCVRPSISSIHHKGGEGGTGGRKPTSLCPAVGEGKKV